MGTQGNNLELLLLSVLSAGPTHGYGVISILREHSAGELDYQEGTVYPALHRLEADGLVTSANTTVQGRRRRLYSLTAAGDRAAHERRSTWLRYASAVDSVIKDSGRRGVVHP